MSRSNSEFEMGQYRSLSLLDCSSFYLTASTMLSTVYWIKSRAVSFFCNRDLYAPEFVEGRFCGRIENYCKSSYQKRFNKRSKFLKFCLSFISLGLFVKKPAAIYVWIHIKKNYEATRNTNTVWTKEICNKRIPPVK